VCDPAIAELADESLSFFVPRHKIGILDAGEERVIRLLEYDVAMLRRGFSPGV